MKVDLWTRRTARLVAALAIAAIAITSPGFSAPEAAASPALPSYAVPDSFEPSPEVSPSGDQPVGGPKVGDTLGEQEDPPALPAVTVAPPTEQPQSGPDVPNPEAEVLVSLDVTPIEESVEIIPVGAGQADSLVMRLDAPGIEQAIEADLHADIPALSASRGDLLAARAAVVAHDDLIRVETIAPESTGDGFAFALRLNQVDPLADSAWANVSLDWSMIEDNFGGDYGSRLQLFAFPECFLTTPEDAQCHTGLPLERVVGPDGIAVATVPVDPATLAPLPSSSVGHTRPTPQTRDLSMWTSGGGTIIAAVSGNSGAAGTFSATDLAPTGTWNVGQQTGTFSYSIPLEVPPIEAGPVPDLTLRYNSAAVDGRTPASNGQASWVGEGWDLSFGYIERLYANCQIDLPNYPTVVGDNCWHSPFSTPNTNVRDRAAYVMSLGGQTYELIPVGGGHFRTAAESGIRVTRMEWQAVSNYQAQGEYFKVQLPDGSVAYFGLGATGNTGRPFTQGTNSVLTMPVVGDDAGEPCNGVAFCDVAYRWMLDFQHDASFNAMVIEYDKLQNKTVPRGNIANVRDYDMAALPSVISYGSTWAGTGVIEEATAKVEFQTVYRCTDLAVPNPAGLDSSIACGSPAPADKARYPDTPLDLLCSTNCSATTNRTPVFFSTKRLKSITTSVRIGEAPAEVWDKVATHHVVGTYPLPPESSGLTLWLDALYTQHDGTDPLSTNDVDDIYEYATTFDGEVLANRVDWTNPKDKLEKRRLSSIRNSFGGVVDVEYVNAYDPAAGSRHCMTDGTTQEGFAAWKNAVINNPWDNTWDCNRVALTHTLLGASSTTYGIYHKYLVDSIKLRDPIADAPPQVFDYTYVGNPAWAFENDVMYVRSNQGSGHGVESWSSYRGYSEVVVETGSGSAKSYTRTQFFRGLDDAYQGASLGLREVSITPHGAGATTPDHPALQGMVASTMTGPALDIAEAQMRSFTTYGVDTLVTGPRDHNVTFVRQARVDSWTRQPDNAQGEAQWIKSSIETDYDTELRLPITQRTDADIDVAGDETCSTLQYEWTIKNASGNSASNFNDTAFWGGSLYIVVPDAGETWWGGCDTNTGTLTGAWQTFYDQTDPDAATNDDLSRGLPTTELTLVSQNDWLESRATYDAQGRILTAKTPADIENGTQTSWVYTPGDTLSSVTVTNPMEYSSTSWVDVRTGNLVKHVDTNGLYTHYRYDAAGRLVAGWAPAQNVAYTDTDPLTDPADQPGATVLPTVSYIYDANAPGLAVRNRPVAVASAQFTGFDGSTPVTSLLAGSVRRSYTFFDGFGRVVQQHSVAPDGSGGRLVTATGFTDTGATAWSTEPFFDSDPAQFASGLVDVTTATVARHSTTQYDWAGRPLEQSLVLGNPGAVAPNEIATTAYEYLGDTTRVTAPTGAVTESVTDALGRIVSQTQYPENGSALAEILTTYSYRVQGSSEPGDELGFSEVTVTDAAQKATVFVSDLAGRKTELLDPNAGLSTYNYDAAGRVTLIMSATGKIEMDYDDLGRLETRTGWTPHPTEENQWVASSSAMWEYSEVAGKRGLLLEESSTTHRQEGSLTTLTQYVYDNLNRPVSTTVTLPTDLALGDLSGESYTTTHYYDALGQPVASGVPAAGGLPAEFAVTGYSQSGAARTLSVGPTLVSTPLNLVTGVAFSPTGQLLSRTYGNDVTRSYGWDARGQLESLSAVFDPDGAGPLAHIAVQHDKFTRDVIGRITRSENLVADAATGKVTAECFVYDGFNRLAAAWTVGGEGTPGACGTAAPVSSADPVWDVTDTVYASQWGYTSAGRIESHIRNVAGVNVASTLLYEDPDEVGSEGVSPAAVTSVETVTAEHDVTIADGFTSGDYTGDGASARWVGWWVESDDTGSPQHTTGLIDVVSGELRLTAPLPTDPAPTLTRTVDTTGIIDGELQLTLTEWSDSTLADDRLLIEVFADGNPVPVTAVFAGGDGLPAGTGGTPDTVSVDISSLLPADEVTVHLSVTSTVDEQLMPAPVFLIDTVQVVLTVDEATTTDSFTYDAAGRMLTRDVDGVETTLEWDASSNLTSTTADGVVTVYAYDAGGQRVAQATLAAGGNPGTASAYVAGMELTDPNTAVADDVTGTRFYSFGGATVAVRTAQGLSLLLGDEQGSAQIMMPLHTDSNGALLAATQADADATERTAYAPYGARRGEDLEDINRGWLGQVEDTGTGLTYLNARYYDPAIGRFLSPDPLMNPGDPRTLDPYRYADNNPVVYTDATGLWACPAGPYKAACESANSTNYNKAPAAAIQDRRTDPNAWKPDRSGCIVGPCLNANMKNSLQPTPLTHGVLDVAGFAPGVGPVVDLTHGAMYAGQGHWGVAGLYGLAAVPLIGDAFAGGRMATKLKAGAYSTRSLDSLLGAVSTRGLPADVVAATVANLNMNSRRAVFGPHVETAPGLLSRRSYESRARQGDASFFSLPESMYSQHGTQANILFVDLVAAKKDIVTFTISRSELLELPTTSASFQEMSRLTTWHGYTWVDDFTLVPSPNPWGNAFFGAN